ncbi:MAG TPA: SUF system NifU family Fe-S cluster assembly protein [Geobacterales bacterium]|nr:SUF system NifU family Fe-S cluster assembly protein [Geobacterales bacterium]
MNEYYYELILDHWRYPRNKGKMKDPDAYAFDSNPLCGDEVEYALKLDDNKRVIDIKFDGHGCALSQASASILSELVKGKTIEEIKNMTKEELLRELGNPNLGPTRIKCALLSYKTLKLAVYSYLGKKLQEEIY